MKKFILLFIVVLSGCLAVQAVADDEEYRNMPGYFDFGLSEEYSNRETSVEVYVREPLLSIVRAATRREEPELSDLLSRINLMSVRTFSIGDQDVEPLKARVAELDTRLNQQKWEKIARVKERDEQVFVYVKSTGEVIDGLVVMAVEYGDEAAFVNIVGNIAPSDLERLYGRFNIPELDSVYAPASRRTHEGR